MPKALVVFTRKKKEFLIEQGATAAWWLTPAKVRQMKYVICTRNNVGDASDPHPGPGPEPRGSAFLVGRISNVEYMYTDKRRERFRVHFDAYAEVSVPSFWDGSRNPVRYMEVSEVEQRGINFDTLDFIPVTPGAQSEYSARERTADEVKPGEPRPKVMPTALTLSQAKAGLATHFNVPIESIEIIIRA
jgi:hypothetical protein